MFQKFKQLWNRFWHAFKDAYNKVFKNPIDVNAQDWRDTSKINFVDIFITKLNNLCNTEATFDVESDSNQTEKLKELCKDIEDKRFEITAEMLATGDYYVFPAINEKEELYHTYLTQDQVRILAMDGDNITEAYGIIDWYVDKANRIYYLLRHHVLDSNGTLTISYSSIDDKGNSATVEEWRYLEDETVSYQNANSIGLGRYKSPVSSRGLSPVYGVPLNFGCAEIEERIFNDIKMIEREFENAESKIFTDPRNLVKDETTGEYKMIDNIFAIQQRAGQSGAMIDIYSPAIRQSDYYSKLAADMAQYEKQIGTSKGILTENEITSGATATEVRRSNADTLALLDKIRTAMDNGNRMTLQADAVFLNVAADLWSYVADWYDPFENPVEQWQRLLEGKSNNVVEDSDLVRWLFPDLSADEIEEKLARITAVKQVDTDVALEKILMGQ